MSIDPPLLMVLGDWRLEDYHTTNIEAQFWPRGRGTLGWVVPTPTCTCKGDDGEAEIPGCWTRQLRLVARSGRWGGDT